MRAEDAEAVRVVDDQPGIVALGQREDQRQRGEVAVHAEHGVGDDHLAGSIAGGQLPFQRGDIVVRIALDIGPVGLGQLHGVDQRGVVQLVGEHRVAAAGQGRRDGEVGQVAGGEGQGARNR
jgi:hypothetical protein